MALINKGNLSTWLIAAAVGLGTLVHKYTDDIAQMIADQHEPVQKFTGGESLRSVFSPLRAGGSEDPDAKEKVTLPRTESPQTEDPRLSDPEFLEDIKYMNEYYESLKVDILDNPEYTDIEKLEDVLRFYRGLENPRDIAYVAGFGSHEKFMESVRARAHKIVQELHDTIKKDPHNHLENMYRAQDIDTHIKYAGMTGMDESFVHEEFDMKLAEATTGLNENQWIKYLESLYMPAAQQALQNYRTGYALVPVTEEQKQNNRLLIADMHLTMTNVGGSLMRQQGGWDKKPEDVLNLTLQERAHLHDFTTPEPKNSAVPVNAPAPG